jgi:hypothetical protein
MDWIRQAEQDAPAPVRGFAGFLRQDLDAARRALAEVLGVPGPTSTVAQPAPVPTAAREAS